MEYIISFSAIPGWAHYEIAKDLNKKINEDKLNAVISGFIEGEVIQGDLPPDTYIKGTAVALTVIIPFIYDWLIRRRVNCEIKKENGLESITVSGYDPVRVIKMQQKIDSIKS